MEITRYTVIYGVYIYIYIYIYIVLANPRNVLASVGGMVVYVKKQPGSRIETTSFRMTGQNIGTDCY